MFGGGGGFANMVGGGAPPGGFAGGGFALASVPAPATQEKPANTGSLFLYVVAFRPFFWVVVRIREQARA